MSKTSDKNHKLIAVYQKFQNFPLLGDRVFGSDLARSRNDRCRPKIRRLGVFDVAAALARVIVGLFRFSILKVDPLFVAVQDVHQVVIVVVESAFPVDPIFSEAFDVAV